jgi:hypothetical protein
MKKMQEAKYHAFLSCTNTSQCKLHQNNRKISHAYASRNRENYIPQNKDIPRVISLLNREK